MATLTVESSVPAASPRSTVFAGSDHMTTNVAAMNEANVATDVGASREPKVASPPTDGSVDAVDPDASNPASPTAGSKGSSADSKSGSGNQKESGDNRPLSPPSQHSMGPQLHGYPSNLTPQTQPGSYYLGYPPTQMTPEPPSPGPGATVVSYDVGSFFQQPGAFAPHTSPFGGPNTPLSPPRATANIGVAIPPASPLFPRVSSGGPSGLVGGSLDTSTGQRAAGAPPSPNLPYMSPHLQSSIAMANYQVAAAGSQSNNSPDEGSGWGERNQQSPYPQTSPQMNPAGMPYGMPVSRASSGGGGRTYSFEEPSSMLPPSALESPDQGNPAYSPYGGSQGSSGPTGATLFAQQAWVYGGPQDLYSSGAPLQPRPTSHPHMSMPYPGAPMGAAIRPIGPYGQYYPASSPGPPIQTTASNKGPDGANLFIFHIPNHFTNLDMYQLFCPYGNLLSVRIMVEKDTGRSRGFGFVSYDSPESAALAIKELNGFAIGNKRLKVQHKQIRPKDLHERETTTQGNFQVAASTEGNFPRAQFSSNLPPSGPMATQNNNSLWCDDRKNAPSGNEGGVPTEIPVKADESTELTSTSTGGETPLHYGTNDSPSAPTAMSPLASLGTLQNALPDVPGNGTTPE